MSYVLGLALRDFRHSLHANMFSAIALAAVLAPLLVLYGLKLGVINGMLAELRTDPSILAIGIGNYKPLTADDIRAIARLPETGFVVGAPRSIASRVEMRSGPDSADVIDADWLPSAPGDPLLLRGMAALADDEIVLSERLAEKLSAKPGGLVAAAVYRNDQSETFEMKLKVRHVLPRASLEGYRALVSSARLEAISAFSDNYDVAEAGAGGRPLSERVALFDGMRLYARSLESIAPLERAVAAAYGFKTSSAGAKIEWIGSLERVMTGLFSIISVAGATGYALSLWATIAGSVRQNMPQLSLLRLLGMPRGRLWSFPLVQVAGITTLGLALAFLLALAAATAMNRIYLIGAFGLLVCELRLREFAAAASASYLLAVMVAALQFSAMQRVSPSDALADQIA
jgi:putative ABC transport system permease protein